MACGDCCQTVVWPHANCGFVFVGCGRTVLHRRSRLFRNRFADTLRPPDLASIRNPGHRLSLWCNPKLCCIDSNLDQHMVKYDQWLYVTWNAKHFLPAHLKPSNHISSLNQLDAKKKRAGVIRHELWDSQSINECFRWLEARIHLD